MGQQGAHIPYLHADTPPPPLSSHPLPCICASLIVSSPISPHSEEHEAWQGFSGQASKPQASAETPRGFSGTPLRPASVAFAGSGLESRCSLSGISGGL